MANALIGACALYMLLSFLLYAESFREALEERAYMRRRKVARRGADWIQ